ncbi:hypothetical protein N7509_009744 [Penicillium cosmopolitanum]|uniref:Uncharacterized protein n=1 Tax=Penicillium cosmopolitanum TaxID=1131564 RepID=A0A9W9VQ04_9EURO|nr:uncharacterized protein N7509_009744 [Penicillium cosmopolitanum]KAJ5387203.1 hypothetical protein N7509_009744 [Penicillium cosmopolitanum]
MTGLNVSVSAGWYTYTNLGPITTTFTPAPSCTTSGRVAVGYMNTDGGNLYLEYYTEPIKGLSFSGCTPTSTPSITATPTSTGYLTSEEQVSAFLAERISWRAYGQYYSPAMYCPSGWETIGMVGLDASSSLTSTDDVYYYMFNYEDKASVLKDILKPKETMAACCPSGMIADSTGLCYSLVKDYKPSVGYQVAVGYNYQYGTTTKVLTETSGTDTITKTRYHEYETGTTYQTDTYTATFDRAEQSPRYSAFSYAPVITMLYHESDLHSRSATSSATADSTSATNAAGRVSAVTSIWKGLGSVVGVWVAASALGAAMILPW